MQLRCHLYRIFSKLLTCDTLVRHDTLVMLVVIPEPGKTAVYFHISGKLELDQSHLFGLADSFRYKISVVRSPAVLLVFFLAAA